jgi:hypothetical protein
MSAQSRVVATSQFAAAQVDCDSVPLQLQELMLVLLSQNSVYPSPSVVSQQRGLASHAA